MSVGRFLRVIFVVFYFCSFSIFAENVEIETSKGPQQVYVPETQEELREAYLEMAGMYLEERFDHEATLEREQGLIQDNKDLIADVKELSKELREWINKKTRPDPLQVSLAVYWEKDLLDEQTIGLGVDFYIFEKASIGVFFQLPTTVGARLSGRVY